MPATKPLIDAPLSAGFEVEEDLVVSERRGVEGFGGGSDDGCGSDGIDEGEEDEAKVEESRRVPPHWGVKDAVYIASALSLTAVKGLQCVWW